jgi:hypothetical protein
LAVRIARFLPLLFVAVVACGGQSRNGVIKIDAPSIEPHRVAIRTLDPVPTPSPSPAPVSASPAALPSGRPTPTPVAPPSGATITSAAGTQKGAPNSFCWTSQIGAPSQCYSYPQPTQPSGLLVASGETTLIRVQVQIPPDQEAARPFRGTREGYPSQRIPPAIETDLKVDLPAGDWSLDLCATWHDRGEPICWLFRLSVH